MYWLGEKLITAWWNHLLTLNINNERTGQADGELNEALKRCILTIFGASSS